MTRLIVGVVVDDLDVVVVVVVVVTVVVVLAAGFNSFCSKFGFLTR